MQNPGCVAAGARDTASLAAPYWLSHRETKSHLVFISAKLNGVGQDTLVLECHFIVVLTEGRNGN